MEKQWTIYNKDSRKPVNPVDPELVTLTNRQKVVTEESAEAGKLLYRIINSEKVKAFFEK